MRSAASLHVVEAREATASGWAATEAPPPAGAMWRAVLPAKGEASGRLAWCGMTAAGLFRALVITLAWLVALSVATRLRAAVGLGLLLLVLIVGAVAGALS